MIEKAIIKVITKTKNKDTIKILSAIFSWRRIDFSLTARIDIKENKKLAASKIHATPVNSSIIEASLNFDTLSAVRTTRQNPNKLDDVLRICCEFPFAIKFSFYNYCHFCLPEVLLTNFQP